MSASEPDADWEAYIPLAGGTRNRAIRASIPELRHDGTQDAGDMQWRRADGSTGTYEGPLFDLGYGIPRRIPAYGLRRSLFDLAFGYVSGFPVRDIIPFTLRSLLPSKPATVTLHPCPECDGMLLGPPESGINHSNGAHVTPAPPS